MTNETGTSAEAVEQLRNKLTSEAVNGEIDRKFAGEIDNIIASLAARLAESEAELHTMKTAGIIEVAVRNPQVSEYIRHWETRAEAAEAKLKTARGALYDAGLVLSDWEPLPSPGASQARQALALIDQPTTRRQALKEMQDIAPDLDQSAAPDVKVQEAARAQETARVQEAARVLLDAVESGKIPDRILFYDDAPSAWFRFLAGKDTGDAT